MVEPEAPPEPSSARRPGSGRSALVGLLAAAVLAVVTLGAVTVARPAPVAPTTGSPTSVVEAYAAAVLAQDWATAWSTLSAKARNGWSYEDFSSMGVLPAEVKQSLVVTGETVSGTAATVKADVTISFGEEMGGNETQAVSIDLVLGEEGAWLIDEPMYGLVPESGF